MSAGRIEGRLIVKADNIAIFVPVQLGMGTFSAMAKLETMLALARRVVLKDMLQHASLDLSDNIFNHNRSKVSMRFARFAMVFLQKNHSCSWNDCDAVHYAYDGSGLDASQWITDLAGWNTIRA